MPRPKSHSKSPFPSRLSAPASPNTICEFVAFATRRHTFNWKVRLDETGHNGTIWALSREDKVDAGSPALSCRPREHVFKVFPLVTSSQDQICEFIEHQDNEREVDSTGSDAIRNADETFLRKCPISIFHFRYCGLEQSAAVDEAIICNEVWRLCVRSAIGFSHAVLPDEGRLARASYRDFMLRLGAAVVQRAM
jgi:hypothetical protein